MLRGIYAAILAAFAVPAQAAPVGPVVVNGSATFSQNGNSLTITNSANAILNWQKFSIAAGESVRFNQPSASSSVLNRVLGADPSVIYGQLSSNGRVWLVNPAGIMVGPSGRVDTAAFVASTLQVKDSDFLAGRTLFANDGKAQNVVNQGEIRTPAGGSVYLIGSNVSNEGIITTPLGETILAAGQTVSLIDSATPGVKVDITGAEGNATNLGTITAEAGRIGIAGALVKNAGTLNASSVVNEGGRIFLRATKSIELADTSKVGASGTAGGSVTAIVSEGGKISGELVARGEILAEGDGTPGSGGFVETSAASVKIKTGFRVKTRGGTWLIDPQDFTIAASGGDIDGTTLGDNLTNSGEIIIESSGGSTWGNGDINVNDNVSWSANALTLTAAHDININAVMTASGTSSLVMNTATENGSDLAVAGGTINVGFNPDGSFKGRVDFPGRSGTGFLTINGHPYTVIDSLGSAGDETTGPATLQGMAAMANLSGYFALGSDFSAAATATWNPDGSGGFYGFAPIGSTAGFGGVLDGLGHVVDHITVNRLSDTNVGLFATVNATGDVGVRNIGLTNISINGNANVGGLAGLNYGAIANSYATGSVIGTGNSFGILVGNSNGSIINSHAMGSIVSGGQYLGGLVGYNDAYGTVENSYANVDITGYYIGGLVGYNGGSIANSYAIGNITGSGSYVGGLAGSSGGPISNSYASGSVSSASGVNIGGLVGEGNSTSTISDSYFTGSVSCGTCYFIGGLVGYYNGVTVMNSHYNIDAVLINGAHHVTRDGLYNSQYLDWFNHGKALNIADYSGTLPLAGGYYQISSVQGMKDLLGFANNSYKFQLAADINLAGAPGLYIPYLAAQEFDGAGHVIDQLSINQPFGANLGLFGLIEHSTVKNLGVTNVSVTGYQNVGGLAGMTKFGNIDSSYTTGSVTGSLQYVGGLVGEAFYGTINNSYASVSVTGGAGSYGIGGLVGINYSTISDSYATGNLSGGADSVGIGGLVGESSWIGPVINSHYNIDAVLINGAHHVTRDGLYNSQYLDWFNHGKTLNIADYSGTLPLAGGYYQISSVQGMKDLLGFANNSGYKFQLAADINLASAPGLYIPYLAAQEFDGAGHVIDQLSINQPFGANLGLFGLIEHSTVKNLGVTNVSVTGQQYVGGLAGSNMWGTIDSSYATGNVSGGRTHIGGLLGSDDQGPISNSYATGNVTGGNYSSSMGGLVGSLRNTTITNSYATGNLSGGSSASSMGGLVGSLSNTSITNSYATGSVSGNSSIGGLVGGDWDGATISNSYATGSVSGRFWIGGLVGSNSATISNSYATGNVTGGGDYSVGIGGLVGNNYGTISNSYATGGVSGVSASEMGGLAGANSGTISNSYATGNVSAGIYDIGGLVGAGSGTVTGSFWEKPGDHSRDALDNGIGTGLDTPLMKAALTFTNAGWSVAVWNLAEGAYPTLKLPTGCAYYDCWTGSVDTNWNVLGNWTNGIPDATFGSYAIGIGAGKTVNVASGTIVLGGLTLGGTLNVNNGIVSFNVGDLALLGGSVLGGDGLVTVTNSYSQVAASNINRTGNITITPPSGSVNFAATQIATLTINASAVTLGPIVSTNWVNLTTDNLQVTGAVSSPAISIAPKTYTAITLGSTAANSLSLLQSDLNNLTAGLMQIYSTTLTVDNGATTVTLPNIDTLQSVTQIDVNSPLTLSRPGSSLFLQGNSIDINAAVTAGTGGVFLGPNATNTNYLLGVASKTHPGNTVELTNTELNRIVTTGPVVIGDPYNASNSVLGTMQLVGAIDLTGVTTQLRLAGNGITQAAGATITVPSLAVDSYGSISLTELNHVGTFAASSTSGNISFANADPLIIGKVATTASPSNFTTAGVVASDTASISTQGALTLSAGAGETVTVSGTDIWLTFNGDLNLNAGAGGRAYVEAAFTTTIHLDFSNSAGQVKYNGAVATATNNGVADPSQPDFIGFWNNGAAAVPGSTLLLTNTSFSFGGATCTGGFTDCWTGAADGVWSNNANWYDGSAPVAPTDKIKINAGAAHSPHLTTGTVTLTQIFLDGNIATDAGVNFNVSDLFTLNSGTATLNGTTMAANYAQSGGTLAGSGTFTVTNSYTKGAGSIARTGDMSITQASGALNFAATQVGALTLNASTINLGAVAAISANLSTAALNIDDVLVVQDVILRTDALTINGSTGKVVATGAGGATFQNWTTNDVIVGSTGSGLVIDPTILATASTFGKVAANRFSFEAVGASGRDLLVTGAVNLAAPLSFKANRNLLLAATVTTSGQNITVNADADSSGGGGVWLDTGSALTSSGGNIVIGGGANPVTGYAIGNGSVTGGHTLSAGITVLGDITAGSGNVTLHGEGANSGSNRLADGITFGDGLLSSNGIVTIDGKAHVAADCCIGVEVTAGVDFFGAGTRLSTQTGTVTITGLNDATNGLPRSQGITVESGTIIETTGTGTLNLWGTSRNLDTAWGVGLFGGTVRTTAPGGGAINIVGTNITQPDGAIVIWDGHVLSSGGAINLTGQSTASSVGFYNSAPNPLMVGGPNSGNITMTGLNTGLINTTGPFVGGIEAGISNILITSAAGQVETPGTLHGNNISLISGSAANPAITLKHDIAATGSLTLTTTNKDISQAAGTITVAGLTTANAGTGAIDLFTNGATNDFGSFSGQGSSVKVRDANAITLGNSSVTSLFQVLAAGAVQQNGDITSAGSPTISVTGASVAMGNLGAGNVVKTVTTGAGSIGYTSTVGSVALGLLDAGAGSIGVTAQTAILDNNAGGLNVKAAYATLTSQTGGTSGGLAISSDLNVSTNILASVSSGSPYGGIYLQSFSASAPATIALTDAASLQPMVKFYQNSSLTLGSGHSFNAGTGSIIVGSGGSMSGIQTSRFGGTPASLVLIADPGNMSLSGPLSMPSSNIGLSAANGVLDIAYPLSGANLTLHGGTLNVSASTSATGDIAAGAGVMNINGPVSVQNAALTAGTLNVSNTGGVYASNHLAAVVSGDINITGGYLKTYAGDIELLVGGSLNMGNASYGGEIWGGYNRLTAYYPDVSIAVGGDIKTNNGAHIKAANSVYLDLLGSTSKLVLNDGTAGYAPSYILTDIGTGVIGTTHLTFLTRTSGGVVIDGVEGTKTVVGGSGFFALNLSTPATAGAGLDIAYVTSGQGGNDTVTAQLADTMNKAAEKALSTTTPVDNDATPQSGKPGTENTASCAEGSFGCDEEKKEGRTSDGSANSSKTEKAARKKVAQCT
jgi:filamentous hemagglutinin family protein